MNQQQHQHLSKWQESLEEKKTLRQLASWNPQRSKQTQVTRLGPHPLMWGSKLNCKKPKNEETDLETKWPNDL